MLLGLRVEVGPLGAAVPDPDEDAGVFSRLDQHHMGELDRSYLCRNPQQ